MAGRRSPTPDPVLGSGGQLRDASVSTLDVPGPRNPVADSGEFPACAATGEPTADLTVALQAAQHGDEAGFVTIYRKSSPDSFATTPRSCAARPPTPGSLMIASPTSTGAH